jgi:hypothetical protein
MAAIPVSTRDMAALYTAPVELLGVTTLTVEAKAVESEGVTALIAEALGLESLTKAAI